MGVFRNFDEILEKAESRESRIISVAAAADEATLKAVDAAHRRGLASAVLVGPPDAIEEKARSCGVDLSPHTIVEAADDVEAARTAVRLVREGEAHVLMKGQVKTSIFMKAVLDKECGLRSGALLSHVFVFHSPIHDKLMMVTDGGINISPTLEQKADIVRNAVSLWKRMGGEGRAKVAALAAVEVVNEKMPETVDAARLQEMSLAGELGDCVVGGPLALDNAISEEAARIKKIEGPVRGDADILLAPDIAAGNILGKSLMFFARTANAGTVVGSAAPVIFLSRADDERTKLNSMALCVAIS